MAMEGLFFCFRLLLLQQQQQETFAETLFPNNALPATVHRSTHPS